MIHVSLPFLLADVVQLGVALLVCLLVCSSLRWYLRCARSLLGRSPAPLIVPACCLLSRGCFTNDFVLFADVVEP